MMNKIFEHWLSVMVWAFIWIVSSFLGYLIAKPEMERKQVIEVTKQECIQLFNSLK